MRLALLFLGGSFLLYARWRIMGTGPPSFTEVDNPASFAENVILRVSSPFSLGFQSDQVFTCPINVIKTF